MDLAPLVITTLSLALVFEAHRRQRKQGPDVARRSLGVLLLIGAVWVFVAGYTVTTRWR